MAIGRLVKCFLNKTMAMLISQMVVLDRRIGCNSRSRTLETASRSQIAATSSSTVVAMVFGLGHDLDQEHNHNHRWSITLSSRMLLVMLQLLAIIFLRRNSVKKLIFWWWCPSQELVVVLMALQLKSSTSRSSSAPPPSLLQPYSLKPSRAAFDQLIAVNCCYIAQTAFFGLTRLLPESSCASTMEAATAAAVCFKFGINQETCTQQYISPFLFLLIWQKLLHRLRKHIQSL